MAILVTVRLFVLVYSVILHEMMHAWSAEKLGDPTGRKLGRITLNPVPHLDPFMTILLPIALAVSTQGRFIFGGAKPVPINHLNFRNPGRGFAISAAAGPLTNLALCLGGMLVMALLARMDISRLVKDPDTYPSMTLPGFFLWAVIDVNLALFAFNMIPIPPLDGSRVLRQMLPRGGQERMDAMERYGLVILVGLLILFPRGLGLIQLILSAPVAFLMTFLVGPESMGLLLDALDATYGSAG